MAEEKIRDMVEEDIKEVVDINREIVGEDRLLTYADNTYSLGGQMGLSKVAEVDGKMIGFVLGKIQAHPQFFHEVGAIIGIGVIPAYHRKGIATRLVKAFMKSCGEKKIKMVRVAIRLHDKPMAAFYQAMGFKQNDIVELSADTDGNQ
jgi:ribosomal protein S18 acetylase RimI-like enzyme